ncbi:MAG: glycosyltransferase family 4 protein [Bacteroidota bacterium]|nr:glycosyltransferase family 4 protein [Bacteroidota bacterium]
MAVATRILYVHHGKGIGGAPLSLLYLIRSLPQRFEPTVLCLHESEASDLFRREGIETIVLPRIHDFSHTTVLWYPWWQLPKILYRFLHFPFAIERARRFIAARRFDLVHLNTSTLLAFGIAAGREGVKVVWHIREPIARGYFGLRRAFVRRIVATYADAVIAISRYDASQLPAAVPVRVVYNFVDREVFHPGADGSGVRRELGLDEKRPLVLFLGGVNRIKGTKEFVRAAVHVLERKKDVVFAIAGPIPDRSLRTILSGGAKYRKEVEASIPPRHRRAVRFLGVRHDVPALLAASTILCFPSLVPHFARPVIEASAMGVPVIASDLGGPQELVRHEETGLLVPAGDVDALAQAILRLLDNPEEARRFGENGTRFAEEHFDAKKNAQAVIDIYDSLLES